MRRACVLWAIAGVASGFVAPPAKLAARGRAAMRASDTEFDTAMRKLVEKQRDEARKKQIDGAREQFQSMPRTPDSAPAGSSQRGNLPFGLGMNDKRVPAEQEPIAELESVRSAPLMDWAELSAPALAGRLGGVGALVGLAVILPIVRNYDDVRSFATEKRADRERARARARARVRSGGGGGEAGEGRRRKRESRPRVTSPFLPRSCDARAPRR